MVTVPTPGMLWVVTWSATLLPSLSSMLVDVEDPSDVDVVDELSSLLVEVVAVIDVDVDEEDEDRSASLVDVLGEVVVGVVGSGVVAPVVADESSTDVLVAPDELVEALALVTEVDVPSSPLAHATPTTARAATIEVNTASILFNI
jgi:hypothetical protein